MKNKSHPPFDFKNGYYYKFCRCKRFSKKCQKGAGGIIHLISKGKNVYGETTERILNIRVKFGNINNSCRYIVYRYYDGVFTPVEIIDDRYKENSKTQLALTLKDIEDGYESQHPTFYYMLKKMSEEEYFLEKL